jgi:hypothetical protein
MKKQFLIFATLTTIVFISCSKEKIEEPQVNQFEEIAGAANSEAKGKGGNPLDNGLLGRFEFDGNLNDKTTQLAPGVSTAGSVLYTTDRKGMANKAIKFNGAYGVNIAEVPLEANMSVSVWVKKDAAVLSTLTPFVEGLQSFSFAQVQHFYQGAYYNEMAGTSQTVVSGGIDGNWHHLAATRDGSSLKFYVDGIFVGSSPSPAGSDPSTNFCDWILGYGYNSGFVYWHGGLDDLRIYNRVLTAVEIGKLSGF